MADFIELNNIETLISTVTKSRLFEVGSPQWIDHHGNVIKLSLLTVMEKKGQLSQNDKDLLISKLKTTNLAHEAICVELWKSTVLPMLEKRDKNIMGNFLVQTILVHELIVITLINGSLKYYDTYRSLQECTVDLIDYCVRALNNLITFSKDGASGQSTQSCSSGYKLFNNNENVIFSMGIQTMSILKHVIRNVSTFPGNVLRRLALKHDLIGIIVDIIRSNPWRRKTNRGIEKFVDNTWILVPKDQINRLCKGEARVWSLLESILQSEDILDVYPFNMAKILHLLNSLPFLNHDVLAQNPSLKKVKAFLCRISSIKIVAISLSTQTAYSDDRRPQIRAGIIAQATLDGGLDALISKQTEIFLKFSNDERDGFAARINSFHKPDFFQRSSEPELPIVIVQFCKLCNKQASVECEFCKAVLYCSRKCQDEHWPDHILECDFE